MLIINYSACEWLFSQVGCGSGGSNWRFGNSQQAAACMFRPRFSSSSLWRPHFAFSRSPTVIQHHVSRKQLDLLSLHIAWMLAWIFRPNVGCCVKHWLDTHCNVTFQNSQRPNEAVLLGSEHTLDQKLLNGLAAPGWVTKNSKNFKNLVHQRMKSVSRLDFCCWSNAQMKQNRDSKKLFVLHAIHHVILHQFKIINLKWKML